jgi:hypothetical protein
VPAVPGGEVGLTGIVGQHPSHSPEDDVALLVAVGVVDGLEIVDVQHDQTYIMVIAPDLLHLHGEQLLKAPVIPDQR